MSDVGDDGGDAGRPALEAALWVNLRVLRRNLGRLRRLADTQEDLRELDLLTYLSILGVTLPLLENAVGALNRLMHGPVDAERLRDVARELNDAVWTAAIWTGAMVVRNARRHTVPRERGHGILEAIGSLRVHYQVLTGHYREPNSLVGRDNWVNDGLFDVLEDNVLSLLSQGGVREGADA